MHRLNLFPIDENFQKTRRAVRSIHINKDVNLTAKPFDDREKFRQRDELIKGTGSQQDPYVYNASGASPHFAIIDMWLRFKNRATGDHPIFIKVSIWTLKVVPEGVVAEDGQLTKLS